LSQDTGATAGALGGRDRVASCPEGARQRIRAILADIEHRHVIACDRSERWSAPEEAKRRLRTELERCHAANRDRLRSCLQELEDARILSAASGLRPSAVPSHDAS